jgi:hypothetical protein
LKAAAVRPYEIAPESIARELENAYSGCLDDVFKKGKAEKRKTRIDNADHALF